VCEGISGAEKDGAKTAGITETQPPPRGKDDFNVIMTIKRERSGEEAKSPGHAKMKKQRTIASEMNEQIFCPATDRQDLPTFEGGVEIGGDQQTESRFADSNFGDG
jgi:hypothetical protein